MSIWISHQAWTQHSDEAARQSWVLLKVHGLITCPQRMTVHGSAKVSCPAKGINLFVLLHRLQSFPHSSMILYRVFIVKLYRLLNTPMHILYRVCFCKIHHHPLRPRALHCFLHNPLVKLHCPILIEVYHRRLIVGEGRGGEQLRIVVCDEVMLIEGFLEVMPREVRFGRHINKHRVDVDQQLHLLLVKGVLHLVPSGVVVDVQLPVPP